MSIENVETLLEELRLGLVAGLEHLAVELEGGEAQFRDIVRSAMDGILVLDDRRTIVFANPSAERMFGRTLADLLGETLPVPLRTGRTADLEIERPDGMHLLVEMSSALTDWEGQRVEVVCLRDVTVRRAEARVHMSNEERYALAAEGTDDGLWDWDLNADTLYTCARWQGQIGEKPEERTDPSGVWLDRVHPEDVERLRADVAAHLDGRTLRLRSRYRIRHRDGTYRPMVARGLAVRDDWGVPVRMAGFQTDVTDLLEHAS